MSTVHESERDGQFMRRWRRAILSAPEFTPSQARVLAAASDYGTPQGYSIRPGVRRLTREASVSRRTVQRALRRAERIKALIPERPPRGGRGLATCYRASFEFVVKRASKGRQKRASPVTPQDGDLRSPSPSGTKYTEAAMKEEGQGESPPSPPLAPWKYRQLATSRLIAYFAGMGIGPREAEIIVTMLENDGLAAAEIVTMIDDDAKHPKILEAVQRQLRDREEVAL